MADKADQLLEERTHALVSALASSTVCKKLDDLFLGGATQVVKKFEKDWPPQGTKPDRALIDKSEKTLDLMADVHTIFRTTTQVYHMFLPNNLCLESGSGEKWEYSLEELDSQGRPVYFSAKDGSYLRWYEVPGQGGVWAAGTNQDGKEPGKFHLNSTMPTDEGVWERPGGGRVPEVSCTCTDKAVLSANAVDAMAQIWRKRRSLKETLEEYAEIFDRVEIGERKVSSGETFHQVAYDLLVAMCDVLEKLGVGKPKRPSYAEWSYIAESLLSVASCASANKEPVWELLSKQLPFFANDGYEVTWVQCMVYMCRLLDVCDCRDPSQPFLLRLCNRVFLRSWQEQEENLGKACVLDLQKKTCTVTCPAPDLQAAGKLRCTAVSDTHGFDGDLLLPQADVLFHCGDVLMEGSAADKDLNVPLDLEATLEVFGDKPFSDYTWIFLIGGNHDRSLHQLWAENPGKLQEKLPPNLVLLQAPCALSPSVQGTCLAKDPSVMSKAENGAIKILGDKTLCAPSDPRPGWVVAGSGVSLANNSWSANRAFQITKTESAALKEAAEVLVKHSPSVVLTHGPPKGHCDGKRGDEELEKVISQSKTVRFHLFGHVHEPYGVDFSNDKAYVNCSISSPVYVPCREPMVFDLTEDDMTTPVPGKVTAEEKSMAREHRMLKLTGLPSYSTAWQVCKHMGAEFVVSRVFGPNATEAIAHFEHDGDAVAVLEALREKQFNGRAVKLDPCTASEAAGKEHTCLFDIINTSKSGKISEQELIAAYDDYILPRKPVPGFRGTGKHLPFLEFAYCGLDRSVPDELWREVFKQPAGEAGKRVRLVAAFQLAYQGYPWAPSAKYMPGAPLEDRRYKGLVYADWSEVKNIIQTKLPRGAGVSFHLNETPDCPYVSGILRGDPDAMRLVETLVHEYRAAHVQINLTASGVPVELFGQGREGDKAAEVLQRLCHSYPTVLFVVPLSKMTRQDKVEIDTMPFFEKLTSMGKRPSNLCGFFDASAGTGKEPDAAPEVPTSYPKSMAHRVGFTGGVHEGNAKLWLDRYAQRARAYGVQLLCDAQSGFREDRKRDKPVDPSALRKLAAAVREWVEAQ